MTGGPIWIPCEGAGCPAHPVASHHQFAEGMCAMCGRIVTIDAEAIASDHLRDDVLARIDRGDFDE